jgi:hypothetical protein
MVHAAFYRWFDNRRQVGYFGLTGAPLPDPAVERNGALNGRV